MTNKKLFLTSYFSDVKNLLPDFAGNNCSGKKIVFIPTAGVLEEETFYIDEDKKSLMELGLIVDELEVSTASNEEIVNKISNADYIFVAGGNTYFLLQELRCTGADKLIIEHINKGKLYIGSSAGSVITAKGIEYLKFMDDPEVAPSLHNDFSAFSVVDFYIVPHYKEAYFEESAEKIVATYSNTLNLCPISNNQVIVVDGEKVKTLTAKKNKKLSK